MSFDGGNAFRPWKINRDWSTKGGWWHVDQVPHYSCPPHAFLPTASQNSRRGSNRCGRVCVQGLVTYYNATADTGGLCVIPGSHRFHDELCNRAASAKSKIDFVSVDADDPILRGGGVLVCAQAGGIGYIPSEFCLAPLFQPLQPMFPLTLFTLQIWCCGIAGLCTATPQPCRSLTFSRCLRKSGGSRRQRSPASSFACAATCAWYPALTQRRRSSEQKSSCFQTGTITLHILKCPI